MKVFLILLLSTTAFCVTSQLPDGAHTGSSPVPLAELIEEAQRNNPDIQTVGHKYREAQSEAKGAGAVPDTELMLQQLNVGRMAASALSAEVQRRLAEVQSQYVAAQASSEQLKIYREGLIPQAEATYRAALAAYEANRQEFGAVLSSFRDLLDFEEQYQKELSEHESALARLESLTGVTLP